MNLSSTQASETANITKPADWSNHMVAAALKFASDEKSPTIYTVADEARIDILNTLNWYEAHGEYSWPNFTQSGFDFAQAMRLRRALINDVYVALQRSGNVQITEQPGVLGTPEHKGRVRGAKQSRTANNQCMAARKRYCKRGNGSDIKADFDEEEKPFWDDNEFLAATMRHMIATSRVDIDSHLNGEKDSCILGSIVHDGLVQVWEKPLALYGNVPEELKRKCEAWEEHKRSVPPRSTQRQRTSNMGVSAVH